MNIVVLDGFAADQGELRWDGLSALGAVTVFPRTTREELRARAASAEALVTNKVVLDRATIEALPRLQYVGIAATGTNAVDLGACRERGIAVTNVPGYSTHSVAELVFALVLHLTHAVAAHDAAVKRGEWARAPDFMFCLVPTSELAGKTFTVIGLGAIGNAVSEIARAFGMRVLAGAVPGSASEGRVPLSEALPLSDIVSLHCPLTPDTTRLVNADFLSRMKSTAILVNTGRGALVDEDALANALAGSRLGGAALDVLTREPPASDNPLLDPAAPFARRIVVTPHLAWATVEARTRLVAEVVENFAAFGRGEARNRVER
jgi:glycerate dehydrogenase